MLPTRLAIAGCLVSKFVVALLSPTDRLKRIQGKMQEYLDNGTRLGGLINRKLKQVEIYQQG